MGIDVNETGRRVHQPSITSPVISGFDLTKQNDVVSKWTSMVQRRLRSSTSQFIHGKKGTIQRPGRTEKKLTNSINSRTRKTYGIIDSASFGFERHGVFVHKGVGRGYSKQGGMVVCTGNAKAWYDADTHPPRHPAPWFNPVLDETIPELADKIAEINADAVVNATRMMIK